MDRRAFLQNVFKVGGIAALVRLGFPQELLAWTLDGMDTPSTIDGMTGFATVDGMAVTPADVTVRPTADYNTNWSCSTGTERFALVDETSHDSDTTYIYRQNSSTNQLFSNLPTLSAGTILGVAVHYVDKEQTGSTTGYPQLRVDGTNYDASGIASDASYTARSYEWTTNPATSSAWTEADVEGTGSNPLQGWGLSSSIGAGEEMRVTQVYLVVRYN